MDPINLHDYERLAQGLLDPAVWDTYAQGSEDEVTLQANRSAFAAVRLRPRVLVDVRACDLTTTVLGTSIRLPVLIAPTSVHRLAHPEGEKATARAARAAGTVLVASTLSSYSLEEIAAAADGSPLWFQFYMYRDRGLTRHMLERIKSAGYRALVLTVDAPYVANRERDRYNQFSLPEQFQFGNFVGSGYREEGAAALTPITWQNRGEREMLTWDAIPWLRSLTSLPILLKGVLTAEDAARAVDVGIDGLIVSNHGGRQLDGVMSTIEALPEVVEAVDGRCEVYMDGGIRRGTDILKALALGARAVLIGRPVFWGLAAGGEAGVRDVLRILADELLLAMRLAGCPTIASIDRSLVKITPLFAPDAAVGTKNISSMR
ncbi:MAG TPA: alpha-hydroxy acid oxidase [Ktedonobacterales bacterium]|nr:alpha-hydroxy acid oxidase [Ktedonobacterales bacterium]